MSEKILKPEDFPVKNIKHLNRFAILSYSGWQLSLIKALQKKKKKIHSKRLNKMFKLNNVQL